MNRLKRDGGPAAPRPGRRPGGVNQNETNPASRSIPSDWYDEKSCNAATHERKSSVHRAVVRRGKTFAVSSSDETRPQTMTVVSPRSPAPNQKIVGAYQTPLAAPS